MQKKFSKYVFNDYYNKKRLNKKSYLSLPILLVFVFLLLGVAIYLKPIKSSNYEFYFVKANTFPTYAPASNLATEIQNAGGGGNLYYKNGYNILINYYNNKADAESVCKKIKENYTNAAIFKIEAKKFKNLQNLTKNQNKSVENLTNSTISSINTLSSTSIKIDKNELSAIQTSSIFNSVFKNYQDCYNEFENQFHKHSKYNAAKEYANKIYLNLQTLSNAEDISNQKIKYLIIDTILNFSSLSFCFWFVLIYIFFFLFNQFHQLPNSQTYQENGKKFC